MDITDKIIKIEKKPDVKKYTNALRKANSTALKFGSNSTDGTASYLSSVIDFENEKVYPCITLDHGMFNPWTSVYAPSKSVIADARIPLELIFDLGAIANNEIKSKYFGVTQSHVIDMIQYRKIIDIIHFLTIVKNDDNKWDMMLPRVKSSSWNKEFYPDRYNDKSKYPDMIPLIQSFKKARIDGPLNLIDKEELIATFSSLLLMQSQSSVPYFNENGDEEYIHTFYTNFPLKIKSLEFHKHTTIKNDTMETSVLVIQGMGTHNVLVFYKYVDIWNDIRNDLTNKISKNKRTQ